MSGYKVFFDFDNTITEFDVLDDLIRQFAIDESWRVAEDEWESGAIGSRECLERQLGVVRIEKNELKTYLASIRVDPRFPGLVEYLRLVGVPVAIVSDSFRSIIETILTNAGVTGLDIWANDFSLDGDRPVIRFPYAKPGCGSGNCKCSHIHQSIISTQQKLIYIGDGRSDICPAEKCDILFAKGSLLEYYKQTHPSCIEFDNLGTVEQRLRLILP